MRAKPFIQQEREAWTLSTRVDIRIIRELLCRSMGSQKPLTARNLMDLTGISEPTVYRHLKALSEANIIKPAGRGPKRRRGGPQAVSWRWNRD